MAPKNKFTKEEIVMAALHVVREKGIDGLTAKTMADALGTSTQPVFTCFGSMDSARQEVYAAALRVYKGYAGAGLQEEIPFLGVGMQYIRFAREEPELYRLLFSDAGAGAGEPCRELDAAFAGACPPVAYGYLPHHCRGSGRLFPRYVACGAQHFHADRDRQLPILRPGDRADTDGLQRRYLQSH